MRLSRLLSPAIALLLVAPLPAQIPPQGWLGDDLFNTGQCCAPVQRVNIPLFPAFKLEGVYCGIKDCALDEEFAVDVSTQHIPITCDVALIPFSVTPVTPGGPGWFGTLIGKYARTWVELDPANPDGPQDQIWRYLVNTDAIATAGAVPAAIPPHPPGVDTHFTGHIDYACVQDPTGLLEFKIALNLNHLPGCISHNQFSASPLLAPPSVDGHHDRSYHLMAPARFICEPVRPPEGPTFAEAVRSTILPPLPYTCLEELLVEGGDLQNFMQDCLCPTVVPAGPMLWTRSFLRGGVFCPTAPLFSSFVGLPVGPPAPPLPTSMTTFAVGRWAGADEFPGDRELVIHFGLLDYFDPCLPDQPKFHIVSGVSTRGPEGLVFNGLFPEPFRVFMDLGDMILANGLFGPYSLGFGTYYLSQVVWNLNLEPPPPGE